MNELTHVDKNGKACMVDVTDKPVTERAAIAKVVVKLNAIAFTNIVEHTHKKGDVLTVAKIAGIQAAKRCSDLIPLCHPIALHHIDVHFELMHDAQSVIITTQCKTASQTGVEMEALTAASVAALTIYDMCKAVDRTIEINHLHLVKKTGGQSDDYNKN